MCACIKRVHGLSVRLLSPRVYLISRRNDPAKIEEPVECSASSPALVANVGNVSAASPMTLKVVRNHGASKLLDA